MNAFVIQRGAEYMHWRPEKSNTPHVSWGNLAGAKLFTDEPVAAFWAAKRAGSRIVLDPSRRKREPCANERPA